MSHIPHSHCDDSTAHALAQKLSGSEDFSLVSGMFALMNDTNRVKIFWLLCHCEQCVINISAFTGLSSPAVSHHLKLLREAGLITFRRDGKEVYYRESGTELSGLFHRLIETIPEITCPKDSTACDKCAKSAFGVSPDDAGLARDIHDYLLNNIDKHVTIEELSGLFHTNTTSVKTLFKKVYGDTVAQHIKDHRMEKAAELLKNTDMLISQVALSVGFSSQSKFTAAFKEYYGIVPGEYRKNKS